MSVLSVDRTRGSASASVTENGRKYEAEFLVKTSSAADNEAIVRAGIAVSPYYIVIGRVHGTDATTYISNISISEYGEDNKMWKVAVTWTTPPPGGGQPNENPLSRPAQIRWYTETHSVPFFKDLLSKQVVNSSGESFEQLPEKEKSELSVSITRNEASPNFSALLTYSDAVNSDTFTVDGVSIPAGYAKMSITECNKTIENGTTFYQITYVLRFRSEGWLVRIADMGYTEIVSGNRKPIIDNRGMEVRRPWPLNGAGGKITSPTGTPSELFFKAYTELPFAPFGF